ncbi:MAG: B12-binding domain-containing radical SAM protein, partial [Gammaproteobacteria bacterium]
MKTNKANILMVYPSFPPTYWGLQYLCPLLGKKSSMPPLGLLTIAALTPEDYSIRLVDLNCETLDDENIAWADMVCFSAMLPQKSSLIETARRCKEKGKLTVFGGPYPTACPEECAPYADVLVLNEGEITWPEFLADYEKGEIKPLYTSDLKPDITLTPVPRFDILKIKDYVSIPLQFSRGCP